MGFRSEKFREALDDALVEVRIPPSPFTYETQDKCRKSQSNTKSVPRRNLLPHIAGSSPVGSALVTLEHFAISQQFRNRFPLISQAAQR